MFVTFIGVNKKFTPFRIINLQNIMNITKRLLLNLKICKHMKVQLTSLLFISICLLLACMNGNNDQKVETDSTLKTTDTTISKTESSVPLDSNDVSFFENAAYGGMMEVESSNKILQLTKDQKIKAFAEMMTKDHGNANVKLKDLAMAKGYELPQVLPDSKMKAIEEIGKFKNEGRDEFYLQLMVAEHKNAINLFSSASRSADESIAKFATTLLPTLNAHLKQVMKLDSMQKLPKVNQGDDPLKLSNRKKY
jgi:putative membrane protein